MCPQFIARQVSGTDMNRKPDTYILNVESRSPKGRLDQASQAKSSRKWEVQGSGGTHL